MKVVQKQIRVSFKCASGKETIFYLCPHNSIYKREKGCVNKYNDGARNRLFIANSRSPQRRQWVQYLCSWYRHTFFNLSTPWGSRCQQNELPFHTTLL